MPEEQTSGESAAAESRFMAPLQLAGRLIMENGGETYRVEETITRMGTGFGLRNVESFAVPSGIFVSYRKKNGEIETAVMRVRRSGINLNRVDAVNSVSRRVARGEMSCEEALNALQAIERRPGELSRPMRMLAAGLSACGFAVMFGGGVADGLVAMLVAALVEGFFALLDRFHMHALVTTLAGSLLSAFLPMIFHCWTGLGTVEVMVAGTLMPLLPGLAMTNAVQDTIRGDMVSGLSHGIQAVLIAALVAGGVLLATALYVMLTGGGAPL